MWQPHILQRFPLWRRKSAVFGHFLLVLRELQRVESARKVKTETENHHPKKSRKKSKKDNVLFEHDIGKFSLYWTFWRWFGHHVFALVKNLAFFNCLVVLGRICRRNKGYLRSCPWSLKFYVAFNKSTLKFHISDYLHHRWRFSHSFTLLENFMTLQWGHQPARHSSRFIQQLYLEAHVHWKWSLRELELQYSNNLTSF